MFHYAIVFAVISLIAAFFGFSGIAQSSAHIAKLILYVFAGLTALSLVTGMVRGKGKGI